MTCQPCQYSVQGTSGGRAAAVSLPLVVLALLHPTSVTVGFAAAPGTRRARVTHSRRSERRTRSVNPMHYLSMVAPLLAAAEIMALCHKINGHILVHTSHRLDRYMLGRFRSQIMPSLKDKCWGIILNNYRYPTTAHYYYSYYSSRYKPGV